jgi:putative aminopeptidase FrvX
MEEDSVEFLRTLVETPSPSGFEDENLSNWRGRVKEVADELRTDAYGNTTATVNPGCETSVVVTGHVDEIALMVNHVTDDGYVYLKKVGGIDTGVAQGQRVRIHGEDGDVSGVVARKPVHLQEDEERDEIPDIHEIYVDVGADDAEEAREAGVHVGATATYEAGFESLLGDVVAGRGLDNRIGAWIAAETLRDVDTDELDVTLHATATVQEELGLRGAKMAGYSLEPDAALVVDVTFATDVPNVAETQHGDVSLGDGPTLKHGKENHPVVLNRLREVADDRGIDTQDEAIMSHGATDADAFYTARGAIPTVSVGVPNRNMHTTSELVDLTDLEAARDLFVGFVESLKDDVEFGRP